jgi:hypothetical protein
MFCVAKETSGPKLHPVLLNNFIPCSETASTQLDRDMHLMQLLPGARAQHNMFPSTSLPSHCIYTCNIHHAHSLPNIGAVAGLLVGSRCQPSHQLDSYQRFKCVTTCKHSKASVCHMLQSAPDTLTVATFPSSNPPLTSSSSGSIRKNRLLLTVNASDLYVLSTNNNGRDRSTAFCLQQSDSLSRYATGESALQNSTIKLGRLEIPQATDSAGRLTIAIV